MTKIKRVVIVTCRACKYYPNQKCPVCKGTGKATILVAVAPAGKAVIK